jgi:hypothetical protein
VLTPCRIVVDGEFYVLVWFVSNDRHAARLPEEETAHQAARASRTAQKILGRSESGSAHARCSPERFARTSSFSFSVDPMSCIHGGPWMA